jgi:hypothetical protein
MCGVHRREKLECQELARGICLFCQMGPFDRSGLPVGPIRCTGVRDARETDRRKGAAKACKCGVGCKEPAQGKFHVELWRRDALPRFRFSGAPDSSIGMSSSTSNGEGRVYGPAEAGSLPETGPYRKWQPRYFRARAASTFAFVLFGSRFSFFLRLCGPTHRHLM